MGAGSSDGAGVRRDQRRTKGNEAMFRLEFDTDNAAFRDGLAVGAIVRILQTTKEKVVLGQTSGKVVDVNGNTIGDWCLDPIEGE